jgi:3-deoxy-D-manno-octulosonic-acid transferase
VAPASKPVIFVAGSTHAPEEEIVLRVFAELRRKHTSLRLILVPRHPDRFEEVAKLLEASGIAYARRSRLTEPPAEPPAILLLDTVGELGAAWSLADVGFTGGSLDGKRGGQSMIEPAGYGVPVVFGPHVWNFRDAAKRLVEVGGAVMVKAADELVPALDKLLSDEEFRVRVGNIARRFVQDNQGATAKTLDVIDAMLARPHS